MKEQIIWIDFGQYGAPGFVPITTFETTLMLRAAEDIVARNSRWMCDHVIEHKRQELTAQALQGDITEDWYSRALLTMALSGLLGYELPEIQVF